MKDIVKVALEWAEQGVPVFPCKSNKAPLTENGHRDATTDPAKIKQLFDFYGEAATHVGGRMGEESGLFAVDFDTYKPGVEAYARDLEERGLLPSTRVHKTLRGGLHFIYEGTEYPNCKPHSGVEVKGEGGYIILSGSPGYSVVSEGVAPAPLPLIQEFKRAKANRAAFSDDILEQNILSADDFHESLIQLASRYASRGMSQTDIQKRLMDMMAASVASQPRHRRHERWSQIMRDNGGEFTRAVSSANDKFNNNSASLALQESLDIGSASEVAFEAGFFDAPNLGAEQEVPVFADDEWPFENEGYFAHEERDVNSTKFNMYPIFAEDETVVIFAEPKTGKTALAITTGLHMACGYDLGPLKSGDGGYVLYYGLEGKRAIELRIESWKRSRRDADAPVPDSIPFFAVEKSRNFVKEETRNQEAAKVIAAAAYAERQGQPLKAVFIDTLTKAMSGADQNSVEDTSSLFEFVNLLRDGGVTATIVFVHHKSRQGNVRGSTNIEAEPDVLLDVSKEGSAVSMHIARARSIEDGTSYNFKLHGYDLGANAQGYKQSGLWVEPLDYAPEQVSADLVGATEDQRKRALIVEMAVEGYTDANAFLASAHQLGLIAGKTKPALKTARAQKLLAQLVPEGGVVFGDHAVRAEKEEGQIVSFEVRHLT